jgi:hypothetical protein
MSKEKVGLGSGEGEDRFALLRAVTYVCALRVRPLR